MAGNNSIQFLRGTSSQISSSTQVALAGQPVFSTDNNKLYIGDGSTQIRNLIPVNEAEHLPNNYIYAGGSSDPKWYKIATITNAPNLAAAGLLLSINGIFATQDDQYGAETGQIEFDAANASGSYSCSASINYGNINPNNVCVVQNGSTAELYYHFDSNYQSILVTVMSFYGGSTASYELTKVGVASAPSGAKYAVNRNIADNAGTLSNKVSILSNTSPGWYKFMEVSNLYASNAYSAILLVNGLLHTNDDEHSNSAKSGVIEVDYYNTSGSATYYTVNILCGNLDPNNFYITASGNSIAVYVNLPNNYTTTDIVQFTVDGGGATTSYISERQSSAPSGGSYAVNRNVAAKGVTPATSSNSDDVATTEWVRSLLTGLTITKSIVLLEHTTSSNVSQLGPGGTPIYPATATINVESLVGDIAPFQFVKVTEVKATSPVGATASIYSDGKRVTLRFDAPTANTAYMLRGTCTYTVVLN